MIDSSGGFAEQFDWPGYWTSDSAAGMLMKQVEVQFIQNTSNYSFHVRTSVNL